MSKYDFIIIGGGSAGCILAARLTESGKHNVLLLEAGGSDKSFWFKLPVGYAKSYYNEKCNWKYYTQPQRNLAERKLYVPRGKVLGGSGSINAMIYVRGQPKDFNDWAAAGNPGWGYDDVLPIFKKLENHPKGDTAYHGSKGLIGITSMQGETHHLCHNYIEALRELNLPLSDDFNGEQFEGGGIYEANIIKGKRSSSNFAYLRAAMRRPNLTVKLNCIVERILFDENKRACGIRLQGSQQEFFASKEVVLAAGAVDSPKLLQLSGIGDKQLLAKHGVAMVHDLPAVGQNLQDHLCACFNYEANCTTLNDVFSSLSGRAVAAVKYALTRKGWLAMSVNQAGGFFRSNEQVKTPNMQIYFNPLSYTIPNDPKSKLKPDSYSGFLACFSPCRPTSRGTINIIANDPSQPAAIDPNYLSTDNDVIEAIAGSKFIRRLMATASMQKVTLREVSPADKVSDDASMLTFFRGEAGSIYHLCGSCMMSDDTTIGVVSSRLKVHGVDGLRVIDASIFPNITSGNTNAAVMMVAEKGSEMILSDWQG